jgi:hypothetical protein
MAWRRSFALARMHPPERPMDVRSVDPHFRHSVTAAVMPTCSRSHDIGWLSPHVARAVAYEGPAPWVRLTHEMSKAEIESLHVRRFPTDHVDGIGWRRGCDESHIHRRV